MGDDHFIIRETFQRPNYLWLYWCMTVSGFFWLLLALIIDQIITAEIKADTTATFTASTEIYWCGWRTITSQSAGLDGYKYTTCGTVECATNNTAGQVWIAFNIMAILLGYVTLGYGMYWDIRQGGFDMSSVRNIVAKMGCTCTFGYTILGTAVLLFWQFFGLIIYSGSETCSKQEMWTSIIISTISSFSSIGGASLGLDILSLIFIAFGLVLLLFIRIQYGHLPRSKTLSTSSPKYEEKKTSAQERGEGQKEAPTSQAPQVPAEPPKSKFFNPSRSYDDKNKKESAPVAEKIDTNVPKNNNTIANKNQSGNKPTKPPPMPGNKPKGPPPVPQANN